MTAPPQEADADVHSRLRSGEYRAAFEVVLPRYRERVFRLTLSMLGNRADAEETVQDVFLRIWRALPGYSGRASLSTWIYAISRNACLSRLRQRRVHVSLDDPEAEDDPAIAELSAPSTDDSAVASVTRMLDQLPQRYQQVVRLFYLEDKSCEQTATALDLPLGTVKALLHRARRRMIDLTAGKPST